MGNLTNDATFFEDQERQAESGEVIVECELCEKVAVLIERATGFYCAECAEEYGGGSDESDRQAERRQMGLVNF